MMLIELNKLFDMGNIKFGDCGMMYKPREKRFTHTLKFSSRYTFSSEIMSFDLRIAYRNEQSLCV